MENITSKKIFRKAHAARFVPQKRISKIPWKVSDERPHILDALMSVDSEGNTLGYLYIAADADGVDGYVYLGILSKSGKPKGTIQAISLRNAMNTLDDVFDYCKKSNKKKSAKNRKKTPLFLDRGRGPGPKMIVFLSLLWAATLIVGTVYVTDKFSTTSDKSVISLQDIEKIKNIAEDIGAEKTPVVKPEKEFKPSFTRPVAVTPDIESEIGEPAEDAAVSTPKVEVETLKKTASGSGGSLLEKFGTPGSTEAPASGKARTQALKDLRKEAENEQGISSIPDPNTLIGRTKDVRMKVPGGGNLKDLSELKSFGLDISE